MISGDPSHSAGGTGPQRPLRPPVNLVIHVPVATAEDEADRQPGVPGFRTWRGVYLFAFGAFVVAVALLAWFSSVFA